LIIADENIDQSLINFLREKDFEVFSIRDNHAGISDNEVVALVKSKKGVLLTEDKDFGELVFAHGILGLAIIFLRYSKSETLEIERRLLVVLTDHYPKQDNFFITITNSKTRLTKI
tara:strand:- start:110 stop:457 length:348 start_codon:yes stop_codon:yes gene_type:complete